MKRKIAAALVLALGLSMLAGCGNGGGNNSSAASSKATENDTFVHGVWSIERLDPGDDYNGWGCYRYGVGETLYLLDDNLNPQPNLATEYKLSDDKLTWTFKLREDVKFQNGKAMDAAAVKACIERTIGMNKRAAEQLDIKSIVADGNTIKFTTNNKNATFLNSLTDPYACIIDVSAGGDFNLQPVGTGPFAVEKYVDKEYVELKAFDEYWGGKPASRRVTVKGVADVDSLDMALQKGEVDSAYGLSYDTLDTYKNSDKYAISQAATTRVYMLYFNLNHEFMNDVNFRKAICMAVDKKTYGEVILNGAGTPTKAVFPSMMVYGKDSATLDVPDYDLEGAKKLLADSGYELKDGALTKGGKKVSLNLITYSRAGLPQSAQALQSALQELGIEVKYELVENQAERCKSGEYDIAAYAYVTAPTGDSYSYLNSIVGKEGNANYGYKNAEVAKLVEQLKEEFDADKRVEITNEIQKKITEDHSFSFMFHLNMFLAFKSDVKGMKQSPVDYYHITKDTCKG